MTVYIRGMRELEYKLSRLVASAGAIADAAVDVYKDGVADDALRLVPVDTGELRDSIEQTDEGVQATADHAAPVEFGTVHMSAQPFLRPAADGADVHTPEAVARAKAVVEAVV